MSASHLRQRLERALGPDYRLERELGGGGMARVFVAEETALGRTVAIKALPPEFGHALSAERFRQEVRLAARLHHPHIVPLLTAGEADGILYYTMPFEAGESLRQGLTREGEFPVAAALRVLRDVAAALASAHGHGIVHRDLKPENILLHGGEALVTDFGVAKAITVAASPDEAGASTTAETLTSRGVALGTPAYMAPEQAAADPQVDHRADLYALGCVAYELLTGAPPFPNRTPQQTLAAQVKEPPEPIDRRRPSLPPTLAALVMRLLEKRPADRPQSADEVLAALEAIAATPSGGTAPAAASAAGGTPSLGIPGAGAPADRVRRAVIAVVVALLIGTAALFAWRRALRPQAAADAVATGGVKTLAVLPFDNLGDSTDRYFADGVTDEIRGKLAAVPGLRVIARTSSDQYRATSRSPQDIGRELGAEYLLSGTVRWDKQRNGASRVRVSPQLIQASTAAAAWQEPFDATLTDVFQVQADIAGRVAEALDVALGAAARSRLAARPTQNLQAYDAYLRAEEATQRLAVTNAPELRRAASLYERAIALDSGFAAAWAGLSEVTGLLYSNTVPSSELAERSRRAAARAVALAPKDARSYAALGAYYLNVESEDRRALDAFMRAHALAPQDAELLQNLSDTEYGLGRMDSSIVHGLRAVRLDPLSARAARKAGRKLASVRRFAEAEPLLERAQALAPRSLAILGGHVVTHLSMGDFDGARAMTKRPPGDLSQLEVAVHMAKYDDLYWLLDSAQQALVLRSRPDDFDADTASWALALAEIYAMNGDRTRTRAYADTARRTFEAQVRVAPDHGERRALLGLSLAYLGRPAEALREGERGMGLAPISRDLYLGAYVQLQVVRIHLLAGDRERALDRLEPLLTLPWVLTPEWLRVDPRFAPLRGHPRFERHVAGRR